MKKYIGERLIKKIDTDIVTFDNWEVETYSEKSLTYLVTNEPKDLTQLRDIMLEVVVKEMLEALQSSDILDSKDTITNMLKVIEENNIRRWDFAAVMDTVLFRLREITDWVVKSYTELFSKAVWKAFWTYKEWKPSEYFFEDIKVSDMKKLIS